MKSLLTCFVFMAALPLMSVSKQEKTPALPITSSDNLFIITIDGFRWQELFTGADPTLICNEKYTPDTATMKMLYWAETETERRRRLMPFFWSVIATKGQLYGNREFGNKVNAANLYDFSYPGYNEIFTGATDLTIASNRKRDNPAINVLEYLNNRPAFDGKVAAFTSWDVFPYILNEKRSGLPVNSGYERQSDSALTSYQQMIDRVQDEGVYDKGGTRYDQLTFLAAKEYSRKNQPRVVFIGLGENDEFAHRGRYDLYLEQANKVDGMIAELWHWIQSTPGYKDHSSLLITTDHGRGSRSKKWASHSALIRGSSQTWLAILGPGVSPLGEVKEEQQLYQWQMASVIALLIGEKFVPRVLAKARR